MTISTATNKAQFSGNGVTTAFPFTFKTFVAGDLDVYLTSALGVDTILALTTHYTISLSGDQDASPGGTLTMLTAPSTGETLTILRTIDATQLTDITNGGGFYPQVVENALDKLTMLAQQNAEKLERAIIVGVTETISPTELLASISASEATAAASAAIAASDAASANDSAIAAAIAASDAASANDSAIAAAASANDSAIAAAIAASDAASANDSAIAAAASEAGASLIGFIQSGAGAVASTAQTELRRVVYAEQYGVSPSKTAGQNDMAFAKAIAAIIAMGGGEIELGVGNFQISDAITLNTDSYTIGIAIVGKGRNTIITQTGTGKDVIKFSTTQFLQNSYLKNLQLVAGSTSGHVVNIVYGCTCCYFDNVEMVQNNPAKALIYGDWTSFGGGVYDTKFRGGSWYCHPASTEAGVRIKANGTIFNENVFENLRCYNANFLQFFHVTTNTTASIWLTNNTLRNINFEVCKGGGVLATSAKGWTLQNLNFWDAGGAYTNHLIDFVAGSGYESASNVLMNISRNGDSLAAGVNDIRILSGQDTTIINCYTSGSPVYDFGGKRVTVIGPLIGTINNKTAMLWLGSQFGGIQFPGSINGSLLNYYDEGTFTAKLTGTATPPTVPVTTVARWTRIGRQVSVEGIFPAANTTGASGNVSITGLPFAVGAVPTIATIAISGLGTDAAVGVANNGTTSITLLKAADLTAGITMVAGTNKYVYFSLQYTV